MVFMYMYGVIQCKMGTVYGEYEIYYLEKKLGKIHFNIVKLMLLVENKVNFFLIYFYFIFEMFPDSGVVIMCSSEELFHWANTIDIQLSMFD